MQHFIRRKEVSYLMLGLWLICLLFLGSYAHFKDSIGGRNLHVVQAKAFTEGHLDFTCTLSDNAHYQGKCYSPFPPLPALFYVPLVILVDDINHIHPMGVAFIITILSMILMEQVGKKWNLAPSLKALWLAAFFLGTGYFYALQSSTGVWTTSQVFAVACLWASLYSATSQKPIQAGLWLAFAFLCRQMTIFNYFFVLALLLNKTNVTPKLKIIIYFHIPLIIGIGLYLFYNYLRFDNFLESGYRYIPPATSFFHDTALKYGNFHIIYFPYNFYYMFLHGFQLHFGSENYWQSYGVDLKGTSLLSASPFVVLALWAKGNKWLIAAAWVSVIAVLFPLLCFANNGWAQINTQRFSLDFLPTLFYLIALGMQNTSVQWSRLLIFYAIGLNVLVFIVLQFWKLWL